MNDSKLRLMLRSADQFLEISNNPKTFIPNFVNVAFSCELYLKYIIYQKTSNKVRGHNLSFLYSEMKKCTDITEFLEHLFVATTFKSQLTDHETLERDLYEMFEEHADIFDTLRYIFERDDKSPVINMTLVDFANALKSYASSLLPNQ